MSELKELLKAGDPAAHEPPLPLVDVQRMRRIVVSTPPAEPRAWWPQPIAVAAALALTIAAAIGLGRQMPGHSDQAAGDTDRARLASSGDSEGTTRQLHFETPGGTQIIWVFDEEFKL